MRPVVLIFCALACASFQLWAEEEVHFNQSIRPVLSDNCFACHGPDANKRKARLRLDLREAALEKKAIVPGKPEESELIKRIFATDPDDLMPPADSHKVLTPAQKELFRKWIAQGAVYEGHWSYVPPAKPKTPAAKEAIDFLVRQRLDELGLTPSPEADRRTLVRRLYFDLAGLPPKPEVVDAFVADLSPGAYERLVDQLLASPQYGERMAIPWLDVVRFADTIGYHSDNPRNVWPYRDYVINAFNENKPFDQFTREQIAGDLLPGSTLEQKVASAFNRLLLSTEEGGAQPKDYEARMLTDRVRAVSTVWLGQTFGCAACHDHKFDPILTRDFYSMGAFFADIKEPIIGRREEGILVPNEKQAAELAALESRVARLQSEYDAAHPELQEDFGAWKKTQAIRLENERFWKQLKPARAASEGGATLEVQSSGSVLAKGRKPNKDTFTLECADLPNPISALRLETLPHDSLPGKGSGRAGNGGFVVSEWRASVQRKAGPEHLLEFIRADATSQSGAADGPAAVIDGNTETGGWNVLGEGASPQHLVVELSEPVKLEEGDVLKVQLIQHHGGNATLGHFRLAATSSYDAARTPQSPLPPQEITDLLAKGANDEADAKKVFAYYKSIAPGLASLRQDLASAKKQRNGFEATLPRCLVSVSSEKPRTVRILPRGNFLDESGEIVQAALPGYLDGKTEQDRPLTRLDLAEWLVSRENPLTARVTMNRIWKQFFGTGLSKVLDDLGAQGEPPPNQALLDWLACEFMDSGWNVKHMVRLIVTSDTYKQSSIPSPELRARDPYNRELAAQSRWRLDAEFVRDAALSISGLLEPTIGGPSVKPYQPEGYWENLNFPPRTYQASQGRDQYRRGLYTWWQRSYLHPSMVAFDAPTREECAAERNRSNIPQQALVLLNDPTYVEASRAFAERILQECQGGTRARLAWAWRQALSRNPSPEELSTLEALLEKHLAEYQGNASAARALLETGARPPCAELEPAELAAWTNVARVILNLHETITRS